MYNGPVEGKLPCGTLLEKVVQQQWCPLEGGMTTVYPMLIAVRLNGTKPPA